MEPYVCSVCNKTLERDLVAYIQHTDRHIIDEIKKKHPDWTDKDGLCTKCFEYFRQQMAGGRRQ